jgi:hypothetical protein
MRSIPQGDPSQGGVCVAPAPWCVLAICREGLGSAGCRERGRPRGVRSGEAR